MLSKSRYAVPVKFSGKKSTAGIAVVSLLPSLLLVSPAFAEAPVTNLDLYIQENRLFTGLQLRDVFSSADLAVSDVGTGNVGDAFDDWGFIEASTSGDFATDGFSLDFSSLGDCSGTVDGDPFVQNTYGTGSYGSGMSSAPDSWLFSCALGTDVSGGVTTTFRSEWKFEGSFWSTKIYAQTNAGTSSYAFSVGGNLGSDEDTKLLSSGLTNGWNFFVTGGEEGDPILGYRSTSNISVVNSTSGSPYVDNDPDGDDDVGIAALTPVTISTTESLAFEVQVWFVDYQDGSYEAASSFAHTYAGVDFGYCIGAAERNTVITADQCETNVIFESNGAVPPLATQHSSSSTSLASAASLLQRDGFDFAGWSTTPSADDAGAVTYTDGQTYDFASDLTLYAQWEPTGSSMQACDVQQGSLDFNRNFEFGDIEKVQVDSDSSSGLDVGSSPSVGGVFHYFNISNACGTQIDARLTITGIENVSDFGYLDYADSTDGMNRWINTSMVSDASGDSYVQYEFEFLTNLTRESGSGTPISLQNFSLSTYDVDLYQYLETTNFASYYLSSDSILSMTAGNDGFTRFSESNGQETDDSLSEATIGRVTIEFADASSLTVRLGQEHPGPEEDADLYLDFSPGLDWSGTQGAALFPVSAERTITPVTYVGPVITNISANPGQINETRVVGLRLSSIDQVRVGSSILPHRIQADGTLVFSNPALPSGTYRLEFHSSIAGVTLFVDHAFSAGSVVQVEPITQKVNAGSFKGYVALYAKGYKGSKMTAIVAGKWLAVNSLASDYERVVRYTGAGYDIVATIYIDGVKIETFNLTTK